MITTKSNLIHWIKLNNCPYWNLYKYDNSREKIGSSINEKEVTIEDSINRLLEIIKMTNTGQYYYIVIRQQISTTSQAGVFKSAFKIKLDEGLEGYTFPKVLGEVSGHGLFQQYNIHYLEHLYNGKNDIKDVDIKKTINGPKVMHVIASDFPDAEQRFLHISQRVKAKHLKDIGFEDVDFEIIEIKKTNQVWIPGC